MNVDLAAHVKLLADRLAELHGRALSAAPSRSRGPDAQLGCGPVLLTVSGPHGARIERARPRAGDGPAVMRPAAGPIAVPAVDARPDTTAAVWSALAAGARTVRVASAPGDGRTGLLSLLAAGAFEHGFPDGAVTLGRAGGSIGDVTQRIAAELEPGAPRFALDGELERIGDGARALILLDGAAPTADGERELAARFPASRFVIAGSGAIGAEAPDVFLTALHPQSIVALLEAGSGRRIDADNRRIALTICSDFAASPGRIRLVGAAMRAFDRSLTSLYVHFGTGERILSALVAHRTPAEHAILELLALADAPLAAHHIAYVVRRSDVDAALDALIGCELIRAAGDGTYELPSYVEPYVTRSGDAYDVGVRLVNVFCDICDSATTIPVLASQLTAAEALLELTAPDGSRRAVFALGPRLAAVYAARAEFDAWQRVLTIVENASRAAGDTTVLNAARHDVGVRALLLGSCAAAAGYLSAAARERHSAGDAAGAAHSAALAAVAGMLASTADSPGAPAQAAAPSADNEERIRHDTTPPAPAAENADWRSLAATAVAFAVVLFVVFAIVSHRAPGESPPLVAFSAYPASIANGATTALCVDAAAAAVIEIFPQADRLPGTGKHCVSVKPAATTTYVAVGTAADGRQVRQTVTVDVRAPAFPPHIIAFSATPARISAGQSTRICYAVTGAGLLRIVPRVGTLTRLRACQTLVLREPHRYRYLLSATSDNGQIAMRQLQVDVAAASAPVVKAVHFARAEQLSQTAIYQFDATPSIVSRGQAASLCVGVERPARGFVTHLGVLPTGITRCYRVEPYRTTVYRLYVALGSATTVQSVTVVVRPSTRRRTVALH